MTKLIGLVVAAVLACAGFACGPVKDPAPGCGPDSATSAQLFQLVNNERAAHGVSPLAWDCGLATEAHDHAVWMAQNNAFVHSDLQTFFALGDFHVVGQNIILGPCSLSAPDLNALYVNSPEHLVNMMNGNFHYGGVGTACNGATGRLGNTEDFGG